MENIKFSVVIPAYNAEKTIIKTISSCFEQEYQPLEIIVINDCSTDQTLGMLYDHYRDNSIVKIFSFEKNKGVSAARNFGWEQAKGDFVAFLDSDDTWRTDKLKIIQDILQNNNTILVLGHNYTNDTCNFLKQRNSKIKILSYRDFLIRNYFNTSSFIVSNKINEWFDEKMRYTEDHDLYLRISYANNIYYIDEYLTLLNRPQLSKGGLSGNRFKMRKGEMYMYYKFCINHPSFIITLPFFFIFSLIKYLYKTLNG